MERRNFAALCAAVLCFWLFALAFGTAQGMGLHLVARREAKTASAQAVWVNLPSRRQRLRHSPSTAAPPS